jgi:hypothetical protein
MRTVQQSGVVWTVGGTDADIFFAPNTVLGTVFILTTKFIEIVHDRFLWFQVLCRQAVVREKRIIANFDGFVNTNRSQGE